MATILSDRIYTPEDLLTMQDSRRLELVRGNLVEKEMGAWEGRIVLLLGGALMQFVESHKLGSAFSETMFRCFPWDPNLVRRPDLSFIAQKRLTDEVLHAGIVPIAPDLAVEIVSPNDPYREIDAKVEEYLQAGVRLVWIVNPDRGSVRIYRPGGSTSVVSGNDLLTGEEVIPGFDVAVSSLLSRPGR